MKSVIPAAGFGTRMLPAAKAVPKELLPVLGKPTIQYVVEEAAEAGSEDVLLVTSREKRAIEDHFDRSPELEQRLEATGKTGLIESILRLRARVRMHSVRQMEQLGLGHAVLQARDHIGERESFLCLLGDTIFSGRAPAAQLAQARARLGEQASVIGLERVPKERVSKYGIVAGKEIAQGLIHIQQLVEKPKPEAAPSDLAIAARYLLSGRVFHHLGVVRPGAGGEIQLTDALNSLAVEGNVYGVILEGHRHDIGSPEGWLATNLKFARQDPGMWRHMEPLIRSLLET